ncbi:MAG: DUF4390 domain-containing protein [Burkholderiales bacterium]|nr:DUF4390 domain-containing protein [Burkholderiales bacterium]
MVAALPLLASSLALPPAALADEVAVRGARLEPIEEGYALDADFDLDLTARLEDALHKGVALYFVIEFECTRPRWYWLDERVATAARSLRLSYHALTRTYRLSSGSLHRTYPALGEALRVLGTVRGWIVIERGQLAPDTTHVAATRVRLDLTQLPKPFQVSALANRDWTLASPWHRWAFESSPAPGEDAAAGAGDDGTDRDGR